MPASTNLTPTGRRTRRPGVYSRTDASGAGLAPGDGIVRLAILGEAEGGIPVSVVADGEPAVGRFASFEAAHEVFRSGPLRDAAYHAFTASNDPRVGRPTEILTLKVNPATRGTAVLPNVEGDAVRVHSRGYGEAANRIAVRLDPGTAGGLRVRVTAEGQRIEADNIGAAPALAVAYDGEAEMDLVVDPGAGLSVPFRLSLAALPADEPFGSSSVARIFSDNAADTYQRATIYGVTATLAPVAHTVQLNGEGIVVTPAIMLRVTGGRAHGLTAGDLTITDDQGDVAFTLPATLTNPWPAGETAVVSSSSPLDVGVRATLVGLDGAGQRVTRSASLNGTTGVPVPFAFAHVVEVHLDGPAVGTVTVAAADATVAVTLAPGVTAAAGATAGLYVPEALPVTGTITLALAAAPVGAPYVVVRGFSAAGERLAVRVPVTAVAANVTGLFAKLEQIELGAMEAASTLLVSGTAFTASPASTWRDVAAKIDGLAGFGAQLLRVADGDLTVAELDAASLTDFGAGAGVTLSAVLYDVVRWLDEESQLLSAERVEGAVRPPDVTPAPIFLAGGGEGVTTLADWGAAFTALRALRDVIIVPLSTEPAVHAQLRAHTRYMAEARIGVDERNGYVPLALTLNRAQIGAAILEIDDANVAACAQRVWRRDPLGVLRTYGPEALAVMLGALQAGSTPPGSQTHKALDVVRFDQNGDWRPDDNAEEMIERGLIFVRREDSRVIVERAVTTYRGDNRVYTEITPNWAAQLLVKGARAIFRPGIGNPNYGSGASSARALLNAYLETQVGTLLVDFDPQRTQVRDLGDALEATFFGRVVETLNFVNLTFFAQAGGSQ